MHRNFKKLLAKLTQLLKRITSDFHICYSARKLLMGFAIAAFIA